MATDVSQDVAHAIFVENNNYDRAKEVIQNFVTDHLLAMFGNSSVMERNEPKMNRIIASIGDIQGFVKSNWNPYLQKYRSL